MTHSTTVFVCGDLAWGNYQHLAERLDTLDRRGLVVVAQGGMGLGSCVHSWCKHNSVEERTVWKGSSAPTQHAVHDRMFSHAVGEVAAGVRVLFWVFSIRGVEAEAAQVLHQMKLAGIEPTVIKGAPIRSRKHAYRIGKGTDHLKKRHGRKS